MFNKPQKFYYNRLLINQTPGWEIYQTRNNMSDSREFYDVVNYYESDGAIKSEKYENLEDWREVRQYAYCLDGEINDRPTELASEESYTVVYTWQVWTITSTDPLVTPDDVGCALLHEKFYTKPEPSRQYL